MQASKLCKCYRRIVIYRITSAAGSSVNDSSAFQILKLAHGGH